MKKLNQNGMTLVEVMIAAAISVIIGLAVMKISQTANKNMAKIKTDGELSDLRNYIRNALSNNENCVKTYNNLGDFFNLPMRENLTNTVPQTHDTITTPYPSSYQNPTTNLSGGIRKYYEISAGADTIYFQTSIYINDTNKLLLKVGETVNGFPAWKFLTLRAYLQDKDGDAPVDDTNGVCSMFFEFERNVGANSQRSFGSKTQSFFLHFSCALDKAHFYNMAACTENKAIKSSVWNNAHGEDISGGISFNDDVYIGTELKNANLYVSGGIYNTSDRALKKNIKKLDNVSTKLDHISGYSFDYKSDDEYPYFSFPRKRQIGVMAQEIEKYFPMLVTEKDGFKRVDYTKLVPILIQAHKEQEEKIEKQGQAIKVLNEKIDKLLRQ